MTSATLEKELDTLLKPEVHLFHYCDEPEAKKELDFEPVDFCQNQRCGEKTYIPLEPKPVEQFTLAIIKPSAQIYSTEIEVRIKKEGFTILAKRKFHFFPEQATDFYKEFYGRSWFPKVMLKLSQGPITVLVLAKENAVQDLKTLAGHPRVSIARRTSPYSLRALYGLRGDGASNGIHASESLKAAKREILYFFPNAIVEPLSEVKLKMADLEDKHYTFLVDGLAELAKARPFNPGLWLLNWISSHDEKTKPLIALPAYPPNTILHGKHSAIEGTTKSIVEIITKT